MLYLLINSVTTSISTLCLFISALLLSVFLVAMYSTLTSIVAIVMLDVAIRTALCDDSCHCLVKLLL